MKKIFKTIPVLLSLTVLSVQKPHETKATAATTAKAECVIESESRRILYERNGDTRLPMASTTKIATAITAIDRCDDLETQIEIPEEAVGIEGSSVYLKVGERYSLRDLLYGLMLRSGNDAATAIAISVGGSVARFSTLMNGTAQKSGALATNFKNPHGLPEDGHYTTARDLSMLTAYAMSNTTFREIVATKFYEPRGWANKNKLLSLYEGGRGVKTGYTKQAGRCLVSAAERQGMTLVCTLLNCSQTYERTAELFDDLFEKYKRLPLVKENDRFEIQDRGKEIACETKESFFYPLLAEEIPHVQVLTQAQKGSNRAKTGEIVGRFEIFLLKQLLFSGNLYKI